MKFTFYFCWLPHSFKARHTLPEIYEIMQQIQIVV